MAPGPDGSRSARRPRRPGPYVSIVMAVHNTPPAWLRQAVLSAVHQRTAFPFELVVCDDGSDVDTARALVEVLTEVKTRWPDFPLELVRHGQRRGPGPARNTAAGRAKGYYLLWLDSDDELADGAVQGLVDTAIQTGAAMTISQCHVVDENRMLLRDPGPYLDLARRFRDTAQDPITQVVFSIQAQLVQASAFEAAGGFSEAYRLAEVTEFFQRMVRHVGIDRVAFLPAPAYRYFRRPGSYSTVNRELFLAYRDQAIRAHAEATGLRVESVETLGRSTVSGAQHYRVHTLGGPADPTWSEAFAPFAPAEPGKPVRELVPTPAAGFPRPESGTY